MPILDKSPLGGTCPCDEQVKYYYAIIDPTTAGFPDMNKWKIDGLFFDADANTVMQTYGGSGIDVSLGVWNNGPSLDYIYGYIAIKTKYSLLPKPIITDPNGIEYTYNWSPIYGGYGYQCDQGYSDFPTCVEYRYSNGNPFVYYLELYWFDQYMWNANTGLPNCNGVPAYYINFVNQYGGALDLNNPSTPANIKAVLDGMFLNGCAVTITPSGPGHKILKVSGVYCNRSGYWDPDTTKWKDGERNTINCP